MKTWIATALVLFSLFVRAANADYAGCSILARSILLTTRRARICRPRPSEDGFPLLVRLHKDFFDFSQAKTKGEDLRVSTRGNGGRCLMRSRNGIPLKARPASGCAWADDQGQRAAANRSALGKAGRGQ